MHYSFTGKSGMGLPFLELGMELSRQSPGLHHKLSMFVIPVLGSKAGRWGIQSYPPLVSQRSRTKKAFLPGTHPCLQASRSGA